MDAEASVSWVAGLQSYERGAVGLSDVSDQAHNATVTGGAGYSREVDVDGFYWRSIAATGRHAEASRHREHEPPRIPAVPAARERRQHRVVISSQAGGSAC